MLTINCKQELKDALEKKEKDILVKGDLAIKFLLKSEGVNPKNAQLLIPKETLKEEALNMSPENKQAFKILVKNYNSYIMMNTPLLCIKLQKDK